jgi:hypothetical protein
MAGMAGLRGGSPELPFVIPLCMEHAKDDDALTNDLVKYLVGKPPEKHPAEMAKVKVLAFGIQFQSPHGGGEFIQELAPEPGPLLLIPILFRLGSDEHEPVHARPRNRASTSRHGAPSEGLAS